MSGDGHHPRPTADTDPQHAVFAHQLALLLALGLDPGRHAGDLSALDTEARVIKRGDRCYVATVRLVSGYGRSPGAVPTTCELSIGERHDTIFQLHAFADGTGGLTVIDPALAGEEPCPRPQLPVPGPLTSVQQDQVVESFGKFLLGLELLDP